MNGNEFKRLLGRKIYYLRTRTGMTQMELAKELGYTSTGTISQIEAGKKGMDHERILKVAKIFNVNPFILLSDTEMSDEKLEAYISLSAMLEDNTDPYRDAVFALLKTSSDRVSNAQCANFS